MTEFRPTTPLPLTEATRSVLPRGATMENVLGSWIRVDMRALMARPGAHEPFHLFSVDGTTRNFVLRPVHPANPTVYSQGPVFFRRNEIVSSNFPPPPQ